MVNSPVPGPRLTHLEDTLTTARRDLADRLNQAVRRLRHPETGELWSRELVNATEGFCERAALFALNRDHLELRSTRRLTPTDLGPIALVSAPAFASAVESRDPVVAMRTRGELSPQIAHMTGEAVEGRCYLFPLCTVTRVPAVLYVDSMHGLVEANVLELLANIAGAILEAMHAARPTTGLHSIALSTESA